MIPRSRALAFLAQLTALLLFAASAAQAAGNVRLALVVGIGEYQSVAPLDNPVRDASLMADALREQGFLVTLLTDPDQAELIHGISEFGRTLRDAGDDATGLFYYAGHGVQSFGTNYLLPADASLVNAADLDLVAIQADAVLRQMASARNQTNIVILDACRNNPFESLPDLNDNGLAEMKAPPGTFLAYSTAPGSVAVDGDGANSPFTAALASAIKEPGVIIEEVFKAVRVAVLEETGGLQVPWDSSSLFNDFVFSPETTLTPEELALQQLWEAVEPTRDPVQIMLFLRANPGSHLEETARALLRDVMAEEMGTAVPKAPVVAEGSPAPEPHAASEPEAAAFEMARSDGTADAYRGFLSRFPSGVYSEIAKVELDAIAASTPAASASSDTGAAKNEPEAEIETAALAPQDTGGPVTFDQPIQTGSAEVVGRSIAELIQGVPLYSPIEGLPDSVWKEKTCSECHSWTQEALCTQATTYLAAGATRALDKQHPLGGGLKAVIKRWAGDGCR